MSSTPEFNDKQLAAARAKAWHQDGEQLLTLEAAREWLDEVGLVFFAPRPQLAAPAPSLVEATLGVANDAPTLAQTQIEALRAERDAARRNALDEAIAPLLDLAAPLRTGAQRDALAACVIRTLHNAWNTRKPPGSRQ